MLEISVILYGLNDSVYTEIKSIDNLKGRTTNDPALNKFTIGALGYYSLRLDYSISKLSYQLLGV